MTATDTDDDHSGAPSRHELSEKTMQDSREGPNLVRRLLTRRKSGDEKATRHAIPAQVQRKLTQVGKRYFFPDGEEAFYDRGRRLTTHSENSALVRMLIAIARERGWKRVEVRGTQQFRQRAWQLALQGGLGVEGYRPTRFERAKAAQLGVAATPKSSSSDASRVSEPQSKNPVGSSSHRAAGGSSAVRAINDGELIVGRIVSHGPERYQFRDDGSMSYHLKLQTDRGVRVLWGKDLPRALTTSRTQVAVGDMVGARRVGREAVTVLDQRRDAAGRVIAQREQQAHRNQWIVEKIAFFTESARLARQTRDRVVEEREASRSDPERRSTFTTLQAAAEFAAQRIVHPRDQERFMEILKQRLEALKTADRKDLKQPHREGSKPRNLNARTR